MNMVAKGIMDMISKWGKPIVTTQETTGTVTGGQPNQAQQGLGLIGQALQTMYLMDMLKGGGSSGLMPTADLSSVPSTRPTVPDLLTGVTSMDTVGTPQGTGVLSQDPITQAAQSVAKNLYGGQGTPSIEPNFQMLLQILQSLGGARGGMGGGIGNMGGMVGGIKGIM